MGLENVARGLFNNLRAFLSEESYINTREDKIFPDFNMSVFLITVEALP